ncbi:MAG: translation initiation factor IF-3 [Candidatus Bipolaricaulota bacterium]|nr:translation initiation factor IF-3 [Candidatus Bipolaricaulota bacterium]
MRVNEGINEKEILVIDEKGENLGVMPTAEAVALAKGRGLDLVEVASQSQPLVCKIIDYGKYHYRQEKRERKQRHRSRLKEMKFTIKIGEHDFDTKMNRVREFLSHGDTVRVTIFFRGREIVHVTRGRDLLARVAQQVSDIARVDEEPKAKGKVLQMLLVPTQS